MKSLLAAIFVLFSLNAHADVPSPPKLEAKAMVSANLEVVYALMNAEETTISESRTNARVYVITKQKIVRYSESNKDSYQIAVVCKRTGTKFAGSAFAYDFACRKITAVNMDLPASDADLLKIKLSN